MRKVVPILIIIGIIAATAIYLGPGLCRSYHLRQANRGMLEAARAGDVAKLASFVLPGQQQYVVDLFNRLAPHNYPKYIESLKVLSYRPAGETTAWAMVSCRMDYEGAMAVYQGKLFWRYDDGHWRWDFDDSFGGEFAAMQEPNWTRLGDLLILAQAD